MSEIETGELKILCPFCEAPYTAKMKEDLHETEGCDTCGYGEEIRGTITITCSNCGKVVYKKEYN